MPDVILGIDTSCYTTSVAFSSVGRIVNCKRRLLSVEQGERGLRQAEGVYQHTRALPELLEQLIEETPEAKIKGICVSARPRNKDDSYMPVFMTGVSFARALAAALHVPLEFTSHQQGHIRAAMVDSGLPDGNFVALHLSGGTTQTVLTDTNVSEIKEIGGTSDLNAGQLVDRTGVYLGLHFPCGPELEKLAKNGNAKSLIPVSSKNLTCSFSGSETQVQRMIKEGINPSDIAMEVYSFLARSIARLIASAAEEAHVRNFLLAGGVASSSLLRELLPQRVKKLNSSLKLYWARPELSGDNACGVALIGDERMR